MFNDQQDKTGTGSKESKAKFDYSYVWMSWVLKRVRKCFTDLHSFIDLSKEFQRMGPRVWKVWSENDFLLFVRFRSLTCLDGYSWISYQDVN